jgi:hypothetical protein
MRDRFRRRLCVLVIGLLSSGLIAAAGAGPANAATGDLVGSVTFSQDCGSGLGVGITYDGSSLWYSCYASSPDLLRADPTTGTVTASYNIEGGLGALAYDAVRNAIWAGPGGGSSNAIYLIQLDASHNVGSSAAAFTPTSFSGEPTLDDGLAYDGTNDSLYFSPDVATTISHYTTTGALFPDNGANWAGIKAGSTCYNSGLGLGGSDLYEGSDGCSHVYVATKTDPSTSTFDFSTLVAGDPNFRDEGLTCDPNTFASQGKQVMWSKEAYSPMRAHAFEIPAGSCGFGGLPAGGKGFLTGGGKLVTSGNPTATFGTELYCDSSVTPDNLQINWGKGHHFHLDTLTGASCSEDPSFSEGQPAAGFNTYQGTGTGKFDGASGATAQWTLTDHGEPGSSDTASFKVTDAAGNVVLNVTGTLTGGNIQAHPAG